MVLVVELLKQTKRVKSQMQLLLGLQAHSKKPDLRRCCITDAAIAIDLDNGFTELAAGLVQVLHK